MVGRTSTSLGGWQGSATDTVRDSEDVANELMVTTETMMLEASPGREDNGKEAEGAADPEYDMPLY